jgi:hypothetical protein
VTAEEQARRQIAAHELAAERNPLKRDQHLASAAYLRRQFNNIENETTFPTWEKSEYLK